MNLRPREHLASEIDKRKKDIERLDEELSGLGIHPQYSLNKGDNPDVDSCTA